MSSIYTKLLFIAIAQTALSGINRHLLQTHTIIQDTWYDDYTIGDQGWQTTQATITTSTDTNTTYHGPHDITQEFYCQKRSSVEIWYKIAACGTERTDSVNLYLNDNLIQSTPGDMTGTALIDADLNAICNTWTQKSYGPFNISQVMMNTLFKLHFQFITTHFNDEFVVWDIQITCNPLITTISSIWNDDAQLSLPYPGWTVYPTPGKITVQNQVFHGPYDGSNNQYIISREFYCNDTASVSVSYCMSTCDTSDAADNIKLYLNDRLQSSSTLTAEQANIPFVNSYLTKVTRGCDRWNYVCSASNKNQISLVRINTIFKVHFEMNINSKDEWLSLTSTTITCNSIENTTTTPTINPTVSPTNNIPSTSTLNTLNPTTTPTVNPSIIPTNHPTNIPIELNEGSIHDNLYTTADIIFMDTIFEHGHTNTQQISPLSILSYLSYGICIILTTVCIYLVFTKRKLKKKVQHVQKSEKPNNYDEIDMHVNKMVKATTNSSTTINTGVSYSSDQEITDINLQEFLQTPAHNKPMKIITEEKESDMECIEPGTYQIVDGPLKCETDTNIINQINDIMTEVQGEYDIYFSQSRYLNSPSNVTCPNINNNIMAGDIENMGLIMDEIDEIINNENNINEANTESDEIDMESIIITETNGKLSENNSVRYKENENEIVCHDEHDVFVDLSDIIALEVMADINKTDEGIMENTVFCD